jgi:hypothetical protein
MSKNTQQKSNVPQLLLAVDLGGSVTKVFYYDAQGNLKVLAMEPLTADVTESEIKNHLQQVVGNPGPEEIAWVKVVDKLTSLRPDEESSGDKTYRVKAVGRLAKYFGGSAELRKAKFELGLFKILAAIGVIRIKLHLPPRLTVAVSVLQPWGEYRNRHQLKEMLADCSNCWVNDERLSINWWHQDFKPEGAGLGMLRGKQLGANFKKRNTAVLMLGHRNSSILVFEKGVVQAGFTSEYGFIELVKRAHTRIPCYTIDRLTTTIIDAGLEPSPKIIRRICKTDSPALQAREVSEAIVAITDARNQFVKDIARWINETLADYAVPIDEIVVGGGVADYLKPELEPRLNTESLWHLQNLPTNVPDEGLGLRLLDVYGVATFLRDKVEKLAVEKKQQRPSKPQAEVAQHG